MSDPSTKVTAILRRYARATAPYVGPELRLQDFGIDVLDLSLIALDLEDAFDIDVDCDDIAPSHTVAGLIERVASLIAQRHDARRARASRARNTRSSSLWVRAGLKS
jgi:acyl carrier protein